jgi:hypothetical protein
MKQYTEILQTPYLVLETPAGCTISNETRAFLSTLNLKGLRLVWEYRAPITQSVNDFMQDFKIINCIDLSRQKPIYNLDVTYSRCLERVSITYTNSPTTNCWTYNKRLRTPIQSK